MDKRISDPEDLARRLIDASHGLSRPCVLPALVEPGFLSHEDVGAMLRNLARHPGRELLLRVFVGGRQCFVSERKVFGQPPAPGADLERWGGALLGPNRWGCTIYRAEQLNDPATTRLARMWSAVTARAGMNLAGQEMFVFLGNYGQTPFGIHQDKDQGATVHFHLGPGLKRMYLWAPEVFERATGGRTTFYDLAAIRDSAEVHEIPAGAAFVLPPDYFHIGETEDFSAGIVLSMVKPTRRRLMEVAFARFLDRAGGDGMADYLPALGRDDAGLPPLGLGEEGTRLDAALSTGLADHLDLLRSNAGFATPPFANGAADVPAGEPQLRRRAPFPLILRHSGDEAHLFLRGQRVVLPASPALAALVAALNDGACLSWVDMCRWLEEDFDSDAAVFLCGELLRLGALEPAGPA